MRASNLERNFNVLFDLRSLLVQSNGPIEACFNGQGKRLTPSLRENAHILFPVFICDKHLVLVGYASAHQMPINARRNYISTQSSPALGFPFPSFPLVYFMVSSLFLDISRVKFN